MGWPGQNESALAPMAITLFSIPYIEERDGENGHQFRRLLKSEYELNQHDELDRWALECLARPRHQFRVAVDEEKKILTLTR